MDHDILSNMPVFQLLTREKCTTIHHGAIRILEQTGISVESQEAVDLLQSSGCLIQECGKTVRIPREIIQRALDSAPQSFTIYDRDGRECLSLGTGETYFGMGTAGLYFHDGQEGLRREAHLDDLALCARVCDALPNLDFLIMPLTVAETHETSHRNVSQTAFSTMVNNTAKPLLMLGEDVDIIKDNIQFAASIKGGYDKLKDKPFVIVTPSLMSPLLYDQDTVSKYLLAADYGLPVRCGSAPLAGMTGPVTLAGMVVLCVAEWLGALVITQLRGSGTPVVVGGTPGIMDMKTANVCYSGPESSILVMALSEMAAFYKLPVFSSACLVSSVKPDEQAAIELLLSIFSSSLSGADLVGHIGGLEAGKGFSLELATIGDELVALIRRITKGLSMDAESLALEVIDAVGPGNSFLDSAHTFKHFRTQQWQPNVFLRSTYDNWIAKGSPNLTRRVQERVNQMLENYEFNQRSVLSK